MKTTARLLYAFLMSFFLFSSCIAFAQTLSGINDTKHNLSVTGPGDVRALTETRICIFCHTPHNAAPSTPLWNKSLEPVSYVLYSSSTLTAVPLPPNGPSRLCLSCHDGTLAPGAVLRPAGGIAVSGGIPTGSLSYLGLELKGDHPFSFSYDDSVSNPYAGLSSAPPPELTFYGFNNFVECSTCHDAHEDAYRSPDIHGNLTGKFLAEDNRYSTLCIKCHSQVDGWSMTSHKTSARAVQGVLPIPPRDWPAWVTVDEWGCEGCHVPHFAGGEQRILYFEEEETNCYICHNGIVAQKNIYVQFQKFSRHPVEATTGTHDPRETPTDIADSHVECVDCHNPHAANDRTASPPDIPGSMDGVSGVTIARGAVMPAQFEYQVCFKCHADPVQQIPFIPRVLNNTNTQETFALSNSSYHPVVGMGRNPNVPSIPSTYEPALTPTSIIYCFDCHGDNTGGTSGPHGSDYEPILKYQYETADGTSENAQSYDLCYHCHNRISILNNDSFSLHREHIVDQNTPCSVCHTAHGVADDGFSGSHTHLINFDTRVVSPVAGNTNPFFTDMGVPLSGSCTLVCHGQEHDNLLY